MPSIVSPGALSTAYSKKRNEKVWFHAKRFMYCIDFAQMTQTNKTTGKMRQIQLIEGVVSENNENGNKFSMTWDDLLGNYLIIVRLKSTSDD